MNQKLIVIHSLALLIAFTFACERIEDAPPALATFVDFDTAGQSTKILLDGTTEGAHRFLDPSGKVLFGGQTFHQARPFRFGYSVVSRRVDGEIRYGVIDETGKAVIPITFPYPIRNYSGGLFQFGLDRIGYLDSIGQAVIPMEYVATKGVHQGLVILQDAAGKWGILNRKGEVVAGFDYMEIGMWSNGMAAASVQQGRSAKWGYLNQRGERAIPFIYDYATTFESDVAMVQQGGKFGLIDPAGTAITPMEFDDFKMSAATEKKLSDRSHSRTELQLVSPEGYISVSKGGKWLTVGVDGKMIEPQPSGKN